MPKPENAARIIKPEEEIFPGVKRVKRVPRPHGEIFKGVKAVNEPPRPGKKSKATDVMKIEEAEVKERLQKARGRIGTPVEEAPAAEIEEEAPPTLKRAVEMKRPTAEKPEAGYKRRRKEAAETPEEERVEVTLEEEVPGPRKKIREEAETLTDEKAQIERYAKETRGMDIQRAKELVPRAADIWERVRVITNEGTPLAHLASLKEAESYGQKPDLPTAYVFALARYAEAYNEYMESKSDETKEKAEKEFQNISALTESLGLGKIEVKKKPNVPEYEVDLSGLDVAMASEPHVARFSKPPAEVQEQVAKDTEEFYEDVADKETHAREVLGKDYNLVGHVNELISNHPAAWTLLTQERTKYGMKPSHAEAFMLAMSRFVDARDSGDAEAVKTEEANVRKLADAIGLTGDKRFEHAMKKPTNLDRAA